MFKLLKIQNYCKNIKEIIIWLCPRLITWINVRLDLTEISEKKVTFLSVACLLDLPKLICHSTFGCKALSEVKIREIKNVFIDHAWFACLLFRLSARVDESSFLIEQPPSEKCFGVTSQNNEKYFQNDALAP